jgi:hypothetical protein
MPPVHKRLHIHLDTTAGFGAYGAQRGDRPAKRPREELWAEIRQEVLLFLESLGLDTPPPPQALR